MRNILWFLAAIVSYIVVSCVIFLAVFAFIWYAVNPILELIIR